MIDENLNHVGASRPTFVRLVPLDRPRSLPAVRDLQAQLPPQVKNDLYRLLKYL
jgi:hypothetical protein